MPPNPTGIPTTTTRPTNTSSSTLPSLPPDSRTTRCRTGRRAGHECRHNLVYWRQQDYTGFGCAAHSHREGRRWWNVRTPDRYIELVERALPTEASGETLDDETRRIEGLQLALRMRDGVPVDSLDGDSLDGLVDRIGDRWVLTRSGRLLANAISLRLH